MTAALSTQNTHAEPGRASASPHQQRHRLPMGRVALGQFGGCITGAVLVIAAAWLTGLLDPRAAALATIPALFGVVVSLAILVALGARTSFTWATVQVGTSALRLGVGLAGALVAFLMLREQTIPLESFGGVVPGKTVFFMAYLVPALATLITDSVVFRAVLIAIGAPATQHGHTESVVSSQPDAPRSRSDA